MYTTLHIMSLYIDYPFAFIAYDTTYTSYIWDSDARSCLSPPADGFALAKARYITELINEAVPCLTRGYIRSRIALPRSLSQGETKEFSKHRNERVILICTQRQQRVIDQWIPPPHRTLWGLLLAR